ncbi:SufE family protein [Alteromonas halophila]|uniref:Fe-S metabolism associated domain-containing protein n=1 Tax=Alteromonas halophila TaxID=516698 RepID=A0A918JE95_9ALTE|nr:SufE family protein [Alteromonas halophila]GGW76528.1 hypothetical protein GCM10007391_06500 [Alteromonas halophila]
MTECNTSPLAASLKRAQGWDEATRVIMLAGKSLPVLAPQLRTAHTRIDGCESPVWLMCQENGQFSAYSDSKILRGVLAILLEQANMLSAPERQDFDFECFLKKCGLTRYLSQSRNNGIRHVIRFLSAH